MEYVINGAINLFLVVIGVVLTMNYSKIIDSKGKIWNWIKFFILLILPLISLIILLIYNSYVEIRLFISISVILVLWLFFGVFFLFMNKILTFFRLTTNSLSGIQEMKSQIEFRKGLIQSLSDRIEIVELENSSVKNELNEFNSEKSNAILLLSARLSDIERELEFINSRRNNRL